MNSFLNFADFLGRISWFKIAYNNLDIIGCFLFRFVGVFSAIYINWMSEKRGMLSIQIPKSIRLIINSVYALLLYPKCKSSPLSMKQYLFEAYQQVKSC